MKKNILVTGGTGFIGMHLIEKLNNLNYFVHVFNSQDGDISSVELNYNNIDHVFHLAAKTFVPASWENPQEFYKVNVMGTGNVLEFCRKNNCSLTLLSTYVYGPPETFIVNEEHPINPNSPYNHSKVLAEELCRFYADKFGMQVTILRPFNIYGPNQKVSFLIPTILNQFLDHTKEKVEVLDLKPKRDYLYIEDLLEAMILTIENNKFSIYNVASGSSISVEEIIHAIMAVTGITKEYISKSIERKNEIMDIVGDITKIKRELNWQPRYSFSQGISRILKKEKKGGDQLV